MSGQSYSFITTGTLIDQAVAEAIGSTASSLTALQDTALIRQVDWIDRQFVNAAHTSHPNEGWSWMTDQRDFFQTLASTTLSANAAEAAVSITVTSATGFPTSGQLFIRTSKDAVEFVPFSAVVGSTVTVSALSMAHLSGEHVELCYPLASTFGKIKRVMVNSVPYFYEDSLDTPSRGHFTFRGAYIVFPYDIGAEDITLVFDKKPTTLSTGDATVDRATSTDIPNDFHRYGVEMLKSYIFTTRRKREDAAQAKVDAETALLDALSYDSSFLSGYGLKSSY